MSGALNSNPWLRARERCKAEGVEQCRSGSGGELRGQLPGQALFAKPLHLNNVIAHGVEDDFTQIVNS
jgi:hypothetical protein